MFSVPETKIVKDVMGKSFVLVDENITLGQAIDLIVSKNEREVMVDNGNGGIKGIVSLTDICKLSLKRKDYKNELVKNAMSKNLISINKDAKLDECRNIMMRNNIGVLPVLENEKLIGVVNQKHIRDFLYMELEDYGITVKHIIGEIKEGICAINTDGKVVLWNKFMENRYGIKSEEIVGKSMENFLSGTISARVLRTKTREGGIYKNNDNENDVYGVVDANPIFINSEFVGVVCTEVDITEAQKLSRKLDKANDRLKYLEDEVKNLSKGSFDNILGRSYKLERAKEVAKRVSNTNSSIFIFGESGTGKEVFARAIHDYSERKGPFIPVNCSAIPSELFESEFFGYEAGSFTGANKKGKMGIFELAKHGTVFLDEIADLPLSMQAKLLRVLQEKEVRRIGGEKTIKIDARIISATNKNLQNLVEEGKFREDLYYRLNVVEIDLPPLRERKEDILLLVNKFIKEICEENNREPLKISKEAMDILQRYTWKGNIRELKNTIENIVVLSTGDIIDKDDIPVYIVESSQHISVDEEYPLDLNKAISKLEVKTIKVALSMTNGNKAKAAKILNIPRTTLYYKIEQYDIEVTKNRH
ncbi:sigma-54 dependent transcriptional regulator PrdR [Paraclostridium bifermentans]|uniref:Sigma-54-dependent Fis family transcriptional regulator n=1 Tax=Paraclostridium bifermentans TaxID=1490 RepID=A0A5P3XF81_PARBF|nr:sigma-54 dependent transcriptional regulator PrdR [Paraclostridium bifermentans]QEZ68985.1 sigma-54-dependent Fis family transcriptional regulator [Paraclostridium bifermentans]TQO56131.1 sigma-54-dependent Fis family transcriptional regulator [Paraclostridium bifermentans]